MHPKCPCVVSGKRKNRIVTKFLLAIQVFKRVYKKEPTCSTSALMNEELVGRYKIPRQVMDIMEDFSKVMLAELPKK